MSTVKRKSRIVTFRVSPEEYEALANSCLEAGAPSMSNFARTAALERLQTTGGRPISISGLNTLGKALGELDNALRDASDRIRRLLGNAEENGKTAGHI